MTGDAINNVGNLRKPSTVVSPIAKILQCCYSLRVLLSYNFSVELHVAVFAACHVQTIVQVLVAQYTSKNERQAQSEIGRLPTAKTKLSKV